MHCFVIVVVVICFAHRALGGRGGAIVWCRFVVYGDLYLVGVRIGVQVCRRVVSILFGRLGGLRWGGGGGWYCLRIVVLPLLLSLLRLSCGGHHCHHLCCHLLIFMGVVAQDK
jgi:hypothetical protein